MSLELPSPLPLFDKVVDRTIMASSAGGEKSIMSFLSKFASLSYSRPEETVGGRPV